MALACSVTSSPILAMEALAYGSEVPACQHLIHMFAVVILYIFGNVIQERMHVIQTKR